MIHQELEIELKKYGLGIIKKEKNYCLIEIISGECYPEMSIYYINRLIKDWNNFNKSV
ncbi:MAG: hypothetical protein ACK5LC_09830 [Coprobacillaceae bacterium]